MTKLKTLSAVAILSAAIASPVLAQDAGMLGPTYHGRAYDQRNFRGAYNQLNAPFYVVPRMEEGWYIEGFGRRDPSRVGGKSPSLNPPGS